MSIPKNHHFVSQCHINNFFHKAEKKIYLYDKVLDNFYFSQSSKSVFSEDFSNSRLVNGQTDHITLETELKTVFEDHFPNITILVTEIGNGNIQITEEKLELLYRLALYGLIGEMRAPYYKKQNDDLLLSAFYDTFIPKDVTLTDEVKEAFQKLHSVKYSNAVSYTKIAIDFLKRMGELDFSIFKITSSDSFLIPDTTSFHIRAKINKYANPDIEEVALVGIPLTDKLFVQVESKKLGSTSSSVITIDQSDSPIVNTINEYIYNSAIRAVGTSNKDELKRIIKKVKKQ